MASKADTLNRTVWRYTPTNATFDPSGIDLKLQARDAAAATRDAQRTADYGPGGTAVEQAVHMTGPLPDPQWQAFFQALKNQNVSEVSGGPSAPGSRQLTGTTAQPDYFSTSDTYFGHLTPTGALKQRAMLQSMRDEQDQFTTNLYAARGAPGTDVRISSPAPLTATTPTPFAQEPFTAPSPTSQLPTDDSAAVARLRSRART